MPVYRSLLSAACAVGAVFAAAALCGAFSQAVAAAEPFSWQLPHATVKPNGDLEWAPTPFVYTAGDSVRYIDFATGDDGNDGSSKATPWKHHPWDAQATGQAAAGSGIHTYVFKRGVTYRGALTVRESGEPGNPIRLTSDPAWGEGEAVISGAEVVTGWSNRGTPKEIPQTDALGLAEVQVWHADLDYAPRNVWIVAADGTVTRLPLARTPNWTVSNPDDVKSEWFEWENPGKHFGLTTTDASGKQQLHQAIDTKNLTLPADVYRGAVVWSEWGWVMGTPYPTAVETVDAAKQALGFRGVWGGMSGQIIRHNRYFLEDKPQFLDAPGEFWFDKQGKGGRLYLRLPGDADPSTVRVEAAARSQVIEATEMRHLDISGLSFRFANVGWDYTVGPWGGDAVTPACIRLTGSGEGIRIHHNRFEDVPCAVRIVAAGDADAIDDVAITDNQIHRTDHGAIVAKDGSNWGRKEAVIGRLYDLKILRNELHTIGLRPDRFGHGHAIEVECAETLEIAGNILNRCYASGIHVFGAKRSGLTADRPLSRQLIHHNKVTDSLLNSNDWGGIETWQGGPTYVYANISANPGGYWHYNYATPNAKVGHRNARFGHAYYLDGAYKNYYFNNIAWGKNNDLDSPLANISAFQEIHSFGNTFFNNTAYRFVVGSRRQAPRGGRDKYLGNAWDDISYRLFRHADPAKSAADANAADAGEQGEAFDYATNAYSRNVFHKIARYGVYEASGRWLDSFADFQAALTRHSSLATELGTDTPTEPLRDPANFDFRPAPGSAVIDAGARVFVPWALHGTVGEWHFYHAGGDPSRIPDEHWYMTPDYEDRDAYPDKPTFPLHTVGMDAAAFVPGALEDWTRGALHFNGRDQYAVLPNAATIAPAVALAPLQNEAADWVAVDAPANMPVGEPATVTLRLTGVPAGQKLQVDLHWTKAGKWAGLNSNAPAQTVTAGKADYTFTLTPKAKDGLDGLQLVIFTSTAGTWQTRDKLARHNVASVPTRRLTPTPLVSPQIGSSNFLIEAYLRTVPGHTGGIIAQKLGPEGGYALRLNAEGKPALTLKNGVHSQGLVALAVPDLNDGRWHHLLAQVDRRAGVITIAVDGVAVASGTPFADTFPADLSLANSGDLTVGGSPEGGGFAGDLDFLRIALGTLADAKTTLEELRAWQFDGPQTRDFTGRLPLGQGRDAGALEQSEAP